MVGIQKAYLPLTIFIMASCGESEGTRAEEVVAIRHPVTSPDAQAARVAEVSDYFQRVHLRGIQIHATKNGPDREIVDWVDPHELDPMYDARVPPPPAVLPPSLATKTGSFAGVPLRLPPPAPDVRARWNDPAIKGPPGTVPVIRPNLDAYVQGRTPARSVEEFLSMILPPQPVGTQHLHAGRVNILVNIGTTGTVMFNDFQGIEPNTQQFSLAQLDSFCEGGDPENTLESIEVGIHKFPFMYGEGMDPSHPPALHFFIWFTTGGYKGAQANFTRSYNMVFRGFVPYAGAFPPGASLGNPASGERTIRAVMSGGVWWVQDTASGVTTTLGYYPVGPAAEEKVPFDLITTEACKTAYFGEVADETEADWTPANMGDGQFGTSSTGSFFRQMIIERRFGNEWFSSNAGGATNPMSEDGNCYTQSDLLPTVPGSFDVWFRYGGPGGDQPGCN